MIGVLMALLMYLSNGEVVPEESMTSAEAEAMVEGARSRGRCLDKCSLQGS